MKELKLDLIIEKLKGLEKENKELKELVKHQNVAKTIDGKIIHKRN